MLSLSSHLRHIMQWLTCSLGIATLLILVYAFTAQEGDTRDLQGRLLAPHLRRQIPWKTLQPSDLGKGVTLPAHTNVIMHIPANTNPITRKVLFGRRGRDVRYWGYCFPKNPEMARRRRVGSFPGTLFLSEKERFLRDNQQRLARRERFSIFRHLREDYLNEDLGRPTGSIRHQHEIFKPGETCYVMSEQPLPVGIDIDGDGLNAALEKDAQTDPSKEDTDGDGISDGVEVMYLGSNPRLRDSDGDGLLDGIEDANKNGRTEMDETSPTKWDTDNDGLCDGLCIVEEGGSVRYSAPVGFEFPQGIQELRGEDKNLNGQVDEGETDPRKWDTDGDGINDEQEYFNCLLTGREDC